MLMGSALILAGGHSARMGYDKKHLMLGGVSVLESLIGKLAALFEEVYVSANDGFIHPRARTLGDEIGVGPLAGIHRGLSVCGSDYLYVTACDMPILSPGYIRYMQEIIAGGGPVDACVARRNDGYYQPFNAFYHKSARPFIDRAIRLDRYGLNRLLDQMKLHVVEQTVTDRYAGGNLFFNINRKEDLRLAETWGTLL